MAPGLQRDPSCFEGLWNGGDSNTTRKSIVMQATAVAAVTDVLAESSLGSNINDSLGKPVGDGTFRHGPTIMDRRTGEPSLGLEVARDDALRFGPIMTQEQCYSRVVRDSVQRNVRNGVNTTILVLGPKHSGTNFTLNGGSRVRRTGGEPMRREGRPAQDAGILPNAVQDLFQTCQKKESLGGGDTVTVYMSYLMVPSEGGAARDLFTSRFPQEQRMIEDGITRIKVESAAHFTRLLSKVMERRASDIAQRRTLHVFITLHVFVYEGALLLGSHSSRLTIAKLGTSMNFMQDALPTSRCGDEDLKATLFEFLVDEQTTHHPTKCKNEGVCLALERQLDRVLSDAESKFIIGCVDTAKSDEGHGTGMLRVLAMATNPPFMVNTDSPKGVADSTNLKGPFFPHPVERSRDASPQSMEFDHLDGTKKPKSNRTKLSRDSTIAAVARMSKLVKSRPSHSTPEQDEGLSPSNSKAQCDQMLAGDVLRENASLKALINLQIVENTECCREIESLKQQLLEVNTRLFDEMQTTGKVDQCKVLQREMATCTTLEDCQGIDECGKDEPLRPCPKGSVGCSDTAEKQEASTTEYLDVSLVSVFEESSTEGSVFHFGEDKSSVSALSTSSSTHHAPATVTHVFTAHGAGNVPTPPKETWIFTNLSSMDNGGSTSSLFSNCECQKSFLSSGNLENIEFFLPSLNVSCLCGKKQSKTIEQADIQLVALLRPWQSEFLACIGIVDVAHFIATQLDDRDRLAKEMVRWRKKTAMKAMPVKACDAALLIWARTCAKVVQPFERNARDECHGKCRLPPNIR